MSDEARLCISSISGVFGFLHSFLNNLDNKEVNYMSKIQAKKYINVKELQEICNISQSSQRDYRGCLHNPLPCHQKVF